MCWLVRSGWSFIHHSPETPGSVTKGQRKVGPVSMESLAQPDPSNPRYSRNSLTKPCRSVKTKPSRVEGICSVSS